MSNTNCLVVTNGFFGDIMFASSLAEKLPYDNVDYLIGFPQMQTLIRNNPFIREVYVGVPVGPNPVANSEFAARYDRVIQLPTLNYQVTPCEEYQQFAGIENATADYTIYTIPEYDVVAEAVTREYRERYGKPVIGVMSNWQEKTYIFTLEQYEAGVDVPGFGYGGKHRDIPAIVAELEQHFTILSIGVGPLKQHQTAGMPDDDTKSLTFEASLLKYCDAFVGTEGGLANLAAGVGCRVILTGDFIHQLYGPNGCIKKIDTPKLGPDKYFPKVGHFQINPYYTDKQVTATIIESITNVKV